ncbi:MAG: pilus assembly protein HicB [Bacteroidales bacterium]|nr:pilus assembly protein HicB [Bacteroidales bacterium]
MQIVAIIEKGKDGFYSIRSEQKVGRYYFGGYGESVKEAKEDFMSSVKESLEGAAADGTATTEGIDVTFKYDIPSFFNFFDYINISKFAEFAGINESRMRAYKSGIAYPGEKTTRKIMKAIETMGKDLSSVRI